MVMGYEDCFTLIKISTCRESIMAMTQPPHRRCSDHSDRSSQRSNHWSTQFTIFFKTTCIPLSRFLNVGKNSRWNPPMPLVVNFLVHAPNIGHDGSVATGIDWLWNDDDVVLVAVHSRKVRLFPKIMKSQSISRLSSSPSIALEREVSEPSPGFG